MPINYLEQLVAEWYEYRGYFLRRNVLVGKRAQGGYEGELDIVAFHPSTKHFVHIESSMDAASWGTRDSRYRKKFDAGRRYIPALFEGVDPPDEIEQIAMLVFASKQTHQTIGGGRIVLVSELLEEIFADLKTKRLAASAIPEHLVILRSFQFVTEYRATIMQVWKSVL